MQPQTSYRGVESGMNIPTSSDTVFVIGNGLSRLGTDLEALKSEGHTIGCNFIYRGGWPGKETTEPFHPDTLCCIDSPPQDQVRIEYGFHPPFNMLTQNVRRTHVLYNREILDECGWGSVGTYWNNSGVIATWFVCEWREPKTVYLIGIDFFRPSEAIVNGKKSNDVYGIYTQGISIHRCFRHLCERYSDTEIVRVGAWKHDADWYLEHVAPYMHMQETM